MQQPQARPNFLSRRAFIQSSAAVIGSFAAMARGQTGDDIHVCPKSRLPARTLTVMRLEELTSHAWDMRLTLTCLPGIVNRSQPRLYLIQDHYDELWLEWLRERGDIDKIDVIEIGQVFERFLPEVRGMVLTDPAISGSVNAATMVAASRRWLVATPATGAQYDLPAGSLPDSWKAGLDLRMMNWKKNIDAYRWVYQELNESLSRQEIAVLDPAAIGLRNYLVESV